MNSGGASGTPRGRGLPVWVMVLRFIVVFAVLQTLWNAARGTALEHFLVNQGTVIPAAQLINAITPDLNAVAEGKRIRAKGGGLNILEGCEGVDVALLLVAAFCAIAIPWRRRLSGLAIGLLVVFALNQFRILALFYTFRMDRALFDALHSFVLPALMVAAVTLFFHARVRART